MAPSFRRASGDRIVLSPFLLPMFRKTPGENPPSPGVSRDPGMDSELISSLMQNSCLSRQRDESLLDQTNYAVIQAGDG